MEPMNSPEKTNHYSLPLWKNILAFWVLIGFLVLLAWALNRTQEPSIQVGDQVPLFTLYSYDGQPLVNTGDLEGKVIVVNFWASWCTPCADEAEDLEQAWQNYEPGGQVVFLGVNWADTEKEARAYLDQYEISYLNGPDLRTAISQMFRTTGVPETYIIDQNGRLAYVEKGPFQSLTEIQVVIDGILTQ